MDIMDIMDIRKIMESIPHRYPFLLIDKVTFMEVGKKITAFKNVTINEQFFQGHFPVEPVMPGVLILEAMAQAGAISIISMPEYQNKIAYFGAIEKAKFRKKVVPGDVLRIEVEIIKLKKSAGIGKGVVYVDDKVVAEGQLTFMIG